MSKPPVVATALVAIGIGLSLASCSQDAEPAAADSEETASTSSSPTSPSSPTDLPSSSEPAATVSVTEEPSPTMTSEPEPDAKTGSRVDVAAALLPPARMGKLNAEWTWRAAKDLDREPKGLASCHRFGFEAIGADAVAVRDYTSELDPGIRAHHLVAGFADDVTAKRAYSVIQSERNSCQSRLAKKSKGLRVSAPDPVRGAGAAATSYLVIKPSSTGSSLIEDVAAARAGRVIHLAVVEIEGDDYNYPRGRTPAGMSVRNAAG